MTTHSTTIGIDARFYGPFGKGLGRYVQKLVDHAQTLPSNFHFRIFLRDENFDDFVPTSDRFERIRAPFPWYSVQEQLGFPRLLARHSIDLMHFPHYNVPLLYRRPFIVTIHDLIVSRFPTQRASTLSPLLYRLKHAAYSAVIHSAVKRARHVLTVSEYSKRELMHAFHLSPERITVTYEAADAFTGTVTERDQKRWRAFQPYLLYVGNAYPHKNLERLVDAMALLQARHPSLRLILVGKMDYFYERLRSYVRDRHLDHVVHFPGYVSDSELAALYGGATLYVFPSLSEGFGLPPLEAMRAGVPVASADSSCLPEILDTAAVFFPPKDTRGMAEVVHRLLSSDRERSELRERGRERVEQFSWDRLARQTLDVYTRYATR